MRACDDRLQPFGSFWGAWAHGYWKKLTCILQIPMGKDEWGNHHAGFGVLSRVMISAQGVD